MDHSPAAQHPLLHLEVEIWRAVCRHLHIQELVQHISPLVARVLPLRRLLVRRLDVERAWLTTVAQDDYGEATSQEPRATRSECSAQEAAALQAWLYRGEVSLLRAEDASPLARVLLPPGLRGPILAGPLRTEAGTGGVVLLQSRGESAPTAEHIAITQCLLEPLAVALENDLRLHEMTRLREALEADRRALLSRLDRQEISDAIVGEATGLRAVMERVEQVAPTDAPVLLLGETGSGKEVIARALHARSRRAGGPIVRVNCGAIPPELVDSELFGHEKGSFTGAVSTRKGWFERADGGTLFLDEIGELPTAAQVRLLRVLQDGSLERVGGHRPIVVDVRIVAATHRDLAQMVAEKTFREDLWYRLNVFPIRLPALRERPEDIPALAAHFAKKAGLRLGGAPLVPSEKDVALLTAYPWPGNVRELAAVIERAAILGDGRRLEIASALGALQPAPPLPAPHANGALPLPSSKEISPLDAVITSHIERALSATRGRIEGPHGAARLLGINPHTLRARMRKLGIDWAHFRSPGTD